MTTLKIGSHQSFAKGYRGLYESMVAQGGNTLQFFIRNPRGSKMKSWDEADARFLKERHVDILVHAPYTLNPASDKDYVLEFAHAAMREDIERLEFFGPQLYNFHPGSHVGQGVEKGIQLVQSCLNAILWDDMATTVLLETMAGKGTELGRTFEELAAIIDGVRLQDKVGVCLDTCHLHEGGYDIVHDLDGVLRHFDETVGLHRLKAVHLNDSKNPRGAHKDRHEEIGKGHIGLQAIEDIINHPALRDLPFYLETPLDNDGHAKEIALLRGLRHEA
ncbi:deoxyribonuclease IV [Peptoniphilus equinus]|uniref:Probable endonuclease 4 n=1 Tax=Peptoniphilus equinus TaxID=3016343 RepID=A0ABY7QTE2_9FIRM|nr:deoxyribonuclease IV [Peptoniphilus equinus]WBW50058.1 deoxyribonuclease IV [Peptoniphilus equinus]